MKTRTCFPATSRLWLAMVIVGTAGCGSVKAPWEKVYPTKGQLVFDGKPIAGAQITLTPVDQSIPLKVRPTAVTQAGGQFELGTFDTADGAPEGDYIITVVWHPVIPGKDGAVRGDNRLPPRYARTETSGLKRHIDKNDRALRPLELKK